MNCTFREIRKTADGRDTGKAICRCTGTECQYQAESVEVCGIANAMDAIEDKE